MPCETIADCEEHNLCVDGICEELPRCDIDSDCSDVCMENPCVCREHHCYEIIPCEVELEHSGVADTLDIPVETVRSRLRHAMRNLRAAIDADERRRRRQDTGLDSAPHHRGFAGGGGHRCHHRAKL